MITEDYVSFETAKLLKEKGFDEKCVKVYLYNGKRTCAQNFMEGESFVSNNDIELMAYYDGWDVITQGEYAYLCPTLQMAMKWLREVHKLNIEFILNQYVQNEETVIKNYYHFNVSRLDRFANEGGDCKFYNSYEEAVENAIKYCLENLI